MRRLLATVGSALVASACAAIAGLTDPDPNGAPDGATPNDGAPASDADTTADSTSTADATTDVADAGPRCTGTLVKQDAFENRTDASAGWARESNTAGGVVEIQNGRLHITVPAAASGVNLHHQLGVTKPGAKKMCASFTVAIVKPTSTAGYAGSGNTTFSFIAADVEAGTYFHGIEVTSQGPVGYAFRPGATTLVRPMNVPLATTWRVLIEADYTTNVLVVGVNDRFETFPSFGPTASPMQATFSLGIRNLGTTPETEAFFDDVVVTAD